MSCPALTFHMKVYFYKENTPNDLKYVRRVITSTS